MSKNLNFLHQKLTLRTTKFQIIVINQLNDLLSIFDTLRFSITKHNYIIYIHETLQIQHIRQYVIHHALEHCWSVLMPKWHPNKLKSSTLSHKRQTIL